MSLKNNLIFFTRISRWKPLIPKYLRRWLGANLINILAAFLSLRGFFEPNKKFKRLDFLPGAQKKLPALGHYISSYGLI